MLLPLAALAGCALWIWHRLLVRLIQGESSTVGWALLVAFLIVLAGRAWARRQPAVDRDALARRWARLDGASLAFVAFAMCLVWLFDHGYTRAASDGREYFVQVRSLVIDRDLDFANENAVFGVRGTADIYAFGAPLLWAPFFLAAHLWLGLLNLFGADFARDGFTNPYQRAIGLGTLVYGVAGLALIMRVLSDHVSRPLAAFATLGMAGGSFLVWYLTVDNSMVHGVSMFATTLFLFVWYRAGRWPSPGWWLAMGAAAGLMALVRWQNLLWALVPLAVLAWEARRAPAGGRTHPGLLRGLGAFAAAAVVVFLPQLVFWRVVRGGWLAAPAAEHGMHLLPRHALDVLFSPHHGLLSWSPVVYLALIGLALFCRRGGRLGLVLGAGFVLQLAVNGAVDVWWGGAGFGARRFDNAMLAFAAGLAALVDWARRRPMVAPAAIVLALVGLNAAVMLDVRRGRLPVSEGLTFDVMLDALYARTGNPFSFPMNAWVAWRYGGDPTLYDRLKGRTYYNLLVDLGEPDDEPFLVEGWSGRERTAEFSFRWSEGPRSAIVVPLVEPAPYTLELRCAPFVFSGAPAQTVRVVVNGTRVADVEWPALLAERTVEIPATAIRRNLNRIEFEYGYARSPRDTGAGDDPRALGVSCDWIRLTRRQ